MSMGNFNIKKSSLNRRSFLKSAAATGALAAVSNSLLSKGAFAAADAPTKMKMSGSHWGVFHGQVQNGRLEKLIPWDQDPNPTVMLEGVLDSIYSPARIKYPMVRRAWLENGPGADPEGRGTGDFVRVSWDKAIELVANELVRVREKHGPSGIFGSSIGWKSVGKLHNCRTLLSRMLKFNGGFVAGSGDYSTGAAQVILPHSVGSLEVYEQMTSYKNLAENSELIVYWGCNPYNTCQIGWCVPEHGSTVGFEMLKKAGVKVICIDPIRTETCDYFNAEWIAPRPLTDAAMMLGIAHTLYTEDLHDKEFLDKYTVGFDKFVPYLIGKTDGVPKSAEWASKICEIPADTIKDLARRFAKNRTMLKLGWSTQRQQHGEQGHWLIVTLASMLGQVGLPGGGFGFSYHYNSAGTPTATSPIVTGITDGAALPSDYVLPGCQPGAKNTGCVADSGFSIPVSRFVEALLNPGKTIDYNGSKVTYPEMKLAYWVGGNPFVHHQNRNQMLEAWRKLDTFIVHDAQWTPTARFADIILPATTSYERNDIEQLGDYSLSGIVPMRKLVEPLYEARSDFDIFTDICKQWGKEYDYTEGLTEMEWIRNFYEKARMEARAKGMEMPVFDVYWEGDEVLTFPATEKQKDFVRHSDFRADPLLNPLGTPSGKIEIFSRNIEKMNYDDCLPHPAWLEPIERLGMEDQKYSLHMSSNHPNYRLHSQLCGTKLRERYAVAGREPCWMNPEDATMRGLRDGDVARAYNDRGQILVGIKVTDDIRQGVVRISEGGWYDPVNPREIGSLCRYGDANNLTTGIAASKLSQATCAHTALIEVEKFEGEIPDVMVFSEPKAQAEA